MHQNPSNSKFDENFDVFDIILFLIKIEIKDKMEFDEVCSRTNFSSK